MRDGKRRLEGVNMPRIDENLARIQQQIAEAARKAGRNPEDVKLLAVSKTFPAADILEAFQAGQFRFGENRVQELASKVPALPDTLEWHLIGHLQSNKAAKAAEFASWIHSVDSAQLASKIGTAAKNLSRTVNVLLEVNISGEESKFGLHAFDDVKQVAEAVLTESSLRLRGLMTMAEFNAEESRIRATFAGLRAMRDRLETELRVPLPELSMGMSSDFEAAIAEGATLVRIGTAIFGGRS